MALCNRLAVKCWQKIFIKPDVIYFCDLPSLARFTYELPESCRVLERSQMDSITDKEMTALCEYIDPKMLRYQLRERFLLGATVWLLKKEENCIGMVWTITGKTVEPFYYLIGKNDIHFFNNEIFQPYRGQGFNPGLIEHVLFEMKKRNGIRAYIETNQRNVPEQRSLSKTSFQVLGKAIKLNLGNKCFTLWCGLD